MPTYIYLIPPVPGECIADPGELEQLVSQAVPGTNIGLVWDSATAPDVVANPEQAKFIWIDRSVLPINHKHWNPGTVSWETPLPADGSITGVMIADYTIPLDKLDPTGGTPGYVLRLNPAGTDVIFDDPQNLFTYVNPLAITVLSRPAAGTWILQSDGTTNSWGSLATAVQSITIPLNKISTTGAVSPMVLGYLGGTTAWYTTAAVTADHTLTINKLQVGPANSILGTNAAGTLREDKTASDIYTLLLPFLTGLIGSTAYRTTVLGRLAIPTFADEATFAHGVASTQPTRFGGWAICTDVGGDGTYLTNDMVPWECFYDTDGDEVINFSVACNQTDLILIRPNAGSGGMLCVSKDGATKNQVIDPAKWKCGGWADFI